MRSHNCPKKCKEKPKCCKKTCCLPSKPKRNLSLLTCIMCLRKWLINLKKLNFDIYISKKIFLVKQLYKKNKIYLVASMIITACILFILHYIEEDEKLADQFQITTSVVVAIAYVWIYFDTYGEKEIKKLITSVFCMLISGIGFTLIIDLLESEIKSSVETIFLAVLCFLSIFLLIIWLSDMSKTIKAFLWGSNTSLYKKFLSRLIALISTLGTIAGTITAFEKFF